MMAVPPEHALVCHKLQLITRQMREWTYVLVSGCRNSVVIALMLLLSLPMVYERPEGRSEIELIGPGNQTFRFRSQKGI